MAFFRQRRVPRCLLITPFHLNRVWQSSHSNGISPVWTLWCAMRLYFLENFLPHSLHWCLDSREVSFSTILWLLDKVDSETLLGWFASYDTKFANDVPVSKISLLERDEEKESFSVLAIVGSGHWLWNSASKTWEALLFFKSVSSWWIWINSFIVSSARWYSRAPMLRILALSWESSALGVLDLELETCQPNWYKFSDMEVFAVFIFPVKKIERKYIPNTWCLLSRICDSKYMEGMIWLK